jgi:uncharacterized membrane protein YfcA
MHAHDLWLLCAGFVAASVNAAAGGGTLLSFPALMATGLPAIAANATSTVGLLPGSIASVWAYRRELIALRAEGLLVLVPALGGGVFGAWLLLHLGGRVFDRVVPFLLLTAAALLAAQPWLSRLVDQHSKAGRGARPLVAGPAPFVATTAGLAPAIAGVVAISVYAGYFGAGAGILFLGSMGLLLVRPLAEINALKVLAAAAANGIGAVTFAASELFHHAGVLSLRSALPLAAGAILGGYFGARLVKRLPAWVLRAVASSVGIGIAFFLAVR